MEAVVMEQGIVRLKVYVCAVLVLCRNGSIVNELTPLELCRPYHSVTI